MVKITGVLTSNLAADLQVEFGVFLSAMIHKTRISLLNKSRARKGKYVLYWMQASQRAKYNHALEFAIRQANERNEPVLVYFGLTDKYPEANERHYYFMLEGLKETQAALRKRSIQMVIRHESPEVGAVRLSGEASLLVCDRGYLSIQRNWRHYVAAQIDCPCIQVESDVVVPIKETSQKEEYTAATIRPKIHRMLFDYLVPLEEQEPKLSSMNFDYNSFAIKNIDEAIGELDIDRSIKCVNGFHGGTSKAENFLEEFLNEKLDLYQKHRNDPNANCLSNMSPYLHFGQISPLFIALRTLETGKPSVDVYLEELIIRRELSINFVLYNERYDSFDCLPVWSKNSLIEHERDRREYEYSFDELESGKTHDQYWNAAQREMVLTGKMHSYMRMYWGKKILEWSREPEEGFRRCLYLNNKYELDGRDPNSFAGVAWCFGKHDRPWAGRPIFGNVRFMSSHGLKRKFDVDKYAKQYISDKV